MYQIKIPSKKRCIQSKSFDVLEGILKMSSSQPRPRFDGFTTYTVIFEKVQIFLENLPNQVPDLTISVHTQYLVLVPHKSLRQEIHHHFFNYI